MKKIILALSLILAMTALVACGGSDSGEVTLESYFADHQEEYEESMEAMKAAAGAMDGMEVTGAVEGNDLKVDLEIGEYYKTMGISDAEMAKQAFEMADVDSLMEDQMETLTDSIKEMEEETGVEGIRIAYRFLFDGESVYEITVDGDGIVK